MNLKIVVHAAEEGGPRLALASRPAGRMIGFADHGPKRRRCPGA
ncbi:MAG: hypothetical protein AB7I59_13200 [Geminicoccaceae bacterium]